MDGISFEIQPLPFGSEGNSDYTLVDTGCLLELLKQTKAFFYLLDKKKSKVAILEKTIFEVVEHLSKSKLSLQEKNAPSFHINGAAHNLRKILRDERIRKIANPIMTDNKKMLNYKKFEEDVVLAYTLYEGNFKGIATKDGLLSKRLGEQKYVSCDKLLKF